MKKHQQTVLIKILILLIIALSGLCVWLYFKKQTPPITPEKQAILERQTDTSSTTPSNNQSTSQQQTTPGDVKPTQNDHSQPSKLSISHQGFNEAGDYELRIFVDYLTKPGASCRLFLNQQEMAAVGLQNLPSSSICKGFRIAKNQLRSGANKFRVLFTDGQFKDEISGEVQQ